ncbi:uncharacterized protein EKO05_0001828 [Ascochyta rabiei]|uniref:Uncharacterized protein n=1 Tax=Didymella rabiei TaxID=5454 RepID=A0A163KUB0_DIDRA|nr:uncharacterized protein EKO05_0001828 [Ascochyta rabiei]KZM27257.1 hypothetical protein ST47_g1595 [Ascochyta rabiei]UPX11208.1 hypothetical protein EKO05_0001828 [Ascochyta rabiei]
MVSQLILALTALQTLASATPSNHRQRSSGLAITSLAQTGNATNGTGNVAAAGTLPPFGDIGLGCGINWQSDVSYGGGLQAGSNDYGLGTGATVTPEAITIGVGIGLNAANASANIQFVGAKNGSFELVFESSAPLVCLQDKKNGTYSISCTTV